MNKVLYLGDTNLATAASYLAGVMSFSGIEFDYLPSDKKFDSGMLQKNYKAIIVSDYPSANFNTVQISAIVEKINGGMGFLMLGGWESFTGFGGGYNNTEFKDVLPVELSDADDRFNSAKACIIKKQHNHDILDKLPFDDYAPLISGFNVFKAKANASILMSTAVFDVKIDDNKIGFIERRLYPLLVISNYNKGKTAAFASDAAPHWVGGFVDWGDKRIDIQAQGGEKLQVGNWYIDFFTNLIRWVM